MANERRRISPTGTINSNKKVSGWSKFKHGLGKVWDFVSKPIKGLVNMIPVLGPTISSGMSALENHFGRKALKW